MKLVKMSLVAAMVMGASAFALDNVKVSGDAKLFYGTNDIGQNGLFDKGDTYTAVTTGAGSYADTALRLGVTGDLLKGVSFGVTGNAVSTLGLEKNLVSNTWTGAHGARLGGNGTVTVGNVNNAQVDDVWWVSEAWMAATMGKTTAKIGRMQLDTPLAFSETWSVAANTFEAAVLINQDLPDTTLVGAWVGKSNGGANTPRTLGLLGADGGVVGEGGTFSSFYNGAYAAAIVNNSWKPLVAQAWYYDVVSVADAFWLQADWECQLVKNLKIGAQYADIDLKNSSADSSAYAFKLRYEGIENLKVSAAYSDTDKGGALNVANIATGNPQSKLYTEAWWNYGYVGAAGAETINLTAEYDVKGLAKFGAYYTTVDNNTAGSALNVDEITLTASKSFGPLDATLAYIATDADNQNLNAAGTAGSGSQYNTVQAYLTLNF